MEILLNGRQSNVDDSHVHANDQQAHAAYAQDQIRVAGSFYSSSLTNLLSARRLQLLDAVIALEIFLNGLWKGRRVGIGGEGLTGRCGRSSPSLYVVERLLGTYQPFFTLGGAGQRVAG